MTGFKEFVIEDVFEKIETKKIKGKANDFPTEPSGNYVLPLLTAGIQNQGLARYAKREQCPTVISNAISVSANGANSGVVFYQPEEFAVLQDAYAIKLKEQEIPCAEVGLFLASSLWKAVASNHDWSFKAGWERIRKDKFSLPVTPSGEIDWDYMHERIAELEHERIAELEHERIAELEQYLIASGLNDCELTNEDNAVLAEYESKDMGEFKIGELFECDKGDVDLQQKDVDNRGELFINSGLENCGVKGRTSREAKVFPANTITVDFWGNAFYRDQKYKLATHNHVFSLSGDCIKNQPVGLFLAASLGYMQRVFSYTNMGTWNKMKVMSVSLPITPSGEPDYDFMDRYLKAIQKLVIADVLKYKDEMIEKTKECVAT